MANDIVSPPGRQNDNDAAFNAMRQALGALQATQFGLSSYLFKEAARLFAADPQTADGGFWESYCLAEADVTEGFNFARNGDRPKSLDCASKAINRFNDEILPAIETFDSNQRDGIRVMALVEFNSIKSFRAVTEMTLDIVKEDYESALHTAGRIAGGLVQDIASLDAAKLPAETVKEMKGGLAAVGIAINGLRAYAEASQAVADRQWDNATKAFVEAKAQLRNAGDAYLAIPRLAAQAQMWPMMVETMVEPARNRAKQLRAVWENFENFKDGMVKLAHAAGATEITNNNVVTSTNQLQNRIEIQISLVNEFEDRTRDALTRLRDAINNAPISQEVRADVLKKIDTLKSSPIHEPEFFDKFKNFTATAADTVANIAKVASPVATAWNLFGPFFGLPALPIP